MNRRLTLSLSFILSLFISINTHAADDDNKVIQWTQNTLVTTLSVSYQENPDYYQFIQSCYTYNARTALHDFLGGKMDIIKSRQLTLHPQLKGPAKILESGVINNSNFFDGVQWWRITQVIWIPELNRTVEFAVTVLETTQKTYLIQALDMKLY
ncbi:hypothetical protein [Legionella oakridgensis]|uniref:Macrophage killing protein with similarity to conjugation protein n=2 Tax=Legionella oakridgensis TaxID=29423 RepID=W0B825_9GAMM|nr:hypothetical protein [Legionella oakridgensis]AHE66025.1 macrophage killing protein with similarity to conjugation protein [Legionella oakridgensis ATCC 33761 = DSM 21215]ETO94255.1 macrophage killing protein with similarity to conjugation protein [Legionella oakridgensis RV-2-2007]KTD43568.1 hypothetical protein Loak_0544 [Legionella oakridgensis]STY15949.1 Uncharacterised protein [Legionella longbeachae]